ncbi:MAG: hypothetical protein M3Z03_09040 [Actinomycetota bacterium]|nr:hypothetical protein [Actinomycetota bacterium]
MLGEADRRKKIAITLSSGAMLTLLSATAAHGAPGTGETAATGNQSSTAAGQTLNMTDGGVVTLNGGVANAGGAGSNSGINQAVGNTDENDDSAENLDGRINNDSVEVGSEGETSLTTGWAGSAGNISTTRLGQDATTRGGDNLIVLNQGAFILNGGLGIANTGINEAGVVASGHAWALGNWADNDVQQVADVTSGTAVQIIGQLELVTSLGAGIANTGLNTGEWATGNATSTGSESRNLARQESVADGDTLAAAVVQQVNRTRNRGLGVANTGINFQSADESDDSDDLTQDPETPTIGGVPIDELFGF